MRKDFQENERKLSLTTQVLLEELKSFKESKANDIQHLIKDFVGI
jgi:hypothetical protein